MKKLLLSVVIALGAMTISAQEAGSMWIGGTLGGNYSNPNNGISDRTVMTFSVNPEIGYILTENIGIGLRVGYGYGRDVSSAEVTTNREITDKTYTRNYSISPFVRTTFLKGSLGAFFVDAGGSIVYSKLKEAYRDSQFPANNEEGSSKMNLYNLGISPGVAVNVLPNFSLIGKFGFLGYTHSRGEGYTSNNYGLSLDLDDITFGAIFTF